MFSIKQFENLGREEMCNTPCPYCGVELTKENITRDHIIPVSSKVRLSNVVNIMYCCSTCNLTKSNTSLLEFVGLISGLPIPHKVERPKKGSKKQAIAERIQTLSNNLFNKIKDLENRTGLVVKITYTRKGNVKEYQFFNNNVCVQRANKYVSANMFANGIQFARMSNPI